MALHPINWEVIEIDENFNKEYDVNILSQLLDLEKNTGCGSLRFTRSNRVKLFNSIEDINTYIKESPKEHLLNLKNIINTEFLEVTSYGSYKQIQKTIVTDMLNKDIPSYYFNLQNRFIYILILSRRYYKKTDITIHRTFILFDNESKVRNGRGILGYIHIRTFKPNVNIYTSLFGHITQNYPIYPAYIDWTCVYLPREIKENIKRNLNFSEVSVAKYLTDEVCKKLLNEATQIYQIEIYGVMMLSISLDSAKESHLRNGKFLACHFLSEWLNIIKKDLSHYFPIENGRRMLYYMYTPDGVPFGEGNRLYDSLVEDGSSIMKRVPDTNKSDFSPENFICPPPHRWAKKLNGELLNNLNEFENTSSEGGRRLKKTYRKIHKRKTRKH